MNPRTTWRWLFLVAVLLALILVHQRFSHTEETGPVKILPNLHPAAVSNIQIRLGQAEIRAIRTNAEDWTLAAPIQYPAQRARIEILLNKLQGLTPIASIGAPELKNRPKADEEFGFANPTASILLEQGEERMRLLFGGKTGPGDQLYLQVVGVETIYIVNADLLKLIPQTANDWRDTTLLNLKQVAFNRVGLTNSGKSFLEFQRDSVNSAWRITQPLALRADNLKIDQALEQLQSLPISQFVSDDPKADLESFGLQPPGLELALAQGTNGIALLQFGKTNKLGEVYARRMGRNTIITVPEQLVSPWRGSQNDFRDPHLITFTRPVNAIEVGGKESFSIVLQTNQTWRVMPQDFIADPEMVKDLLSGLSKMRIIDFVKDVVTESGLADWGLAAPTCRYIVQLDPEPGSSTNISSTELQFAQRTNGVYVRRTDENSVYAISTNDFARLPSNSLNLRSHQLWNIAEDQIAGATIRKEGKTCQIIRKDAYKWTFAPGSQGIIKNELALEETIRGLAKASVVNWVARGEQNRGHYGFRDGSLQLSLDLKSGEQMKLEFGGEAPSTDEYAAVTLDGQPWFLEFPWPLFRDVLTALPIP